MKGRNDYGTRGRDRGARRPSPAGRLVGLPITSTPLTPGTMPRHSESGRAALFALAALAALALAVPLSMFLARSPADQSQAERLGHEIGCVCGTCPLRPIATCGCGFADGMLARLEQEVGAGHSDEEVMASFVADYGSQIQIKPEGRGLGLAAWMAPMALLMVGAVVLAGILSHWRAQGADEELAAAAAAAEPGAEAAPTGGSAGGRSDRYRDIVERELDAFDD